MNLEWQTTRQRIDAHVGPLHLIVGKSKHGHWSWEVNAPDVDDDVQGRAYSLELAKVYAEACARALIMMWDMSHTPEDDSIEYRDIAKEE